MDSGFKLEVEHLLRQALWSPPVGPVEWDEAKIAAASERAAEMAERINRLAITAWNTRTAPPDGGMVSREEIARIILGPKSSWNRTAFGSEPLSEWSGYPEVSRALAKADAILAACGRGGWQGMESAIREAMRILSDKDASIWARIPDAYEVLASVLPPPPEESGL